MQGEPPAKRQALDPQQQQVQQQAAMGSFQQYALQSAPQLQQPVQLGLQQQLLAGGAAGLAAAAGNQGMGSLLAQLQHRGVSGERCDVPLAACEHEGQKRRSDVGACTRQPCNCWLHICSHRLGKGLCSAVCKRLGCLPSGQPSSAGAAKPRYATILLAKATRLPA